jgi:hypothetical protein
MTLPHPNLPPDPELTDVALRYAMPFGPPFTCRISMAGTDKSVMAAVENALMQAREEAMQRIARQST